ncbi:MAG: PepSY-like domain-containing protein [Bacteroidales bacterium]|nr:PepSY-like domain-containing protein [Candidatus Sodaliphilus limicaballi]
MMKKTAIIAVVLFLLTSCGDGIPQAGKDFASRYYPDMEILLCDTSDDDGGCEIRLTGDVEIELDAQGQWESVEDPGGVPAEIVPAAIKKYVADNYMGRTIVKIEHETYGYKVELYGKTKIKFDKQGNFLGLEYKIIEI